MFVSDSGSNEMSEQDNESRVRAFYESTAPGHREAARGLQSAQVVYDMPEGMPAGCGHFEGLKDVFDRFLPSFYGSFDIRFVTEEFITSHDEVVAIGRIIGATRKSGKPVNVPFVHIWTVSDGHLRRMRACTDTAI